MARRGALERVLVVRNDRVGDFMLAWPSLALLKQSAPECQVTVLVSEYSAPLAQHCPWIDEVLIDNRADGIDEEAALLDLIRSKQFEASVSLISRTPMAKLLWKAGVRHRYAPATKLALVFQNRRVLQRRSRSSSSEWAYNVDLVRALLKDYRIAPVEPAPPYLVFPERELQEERERVAGVLGIAADAPWILVHPGNRGSSGNLSLRQYRQLIEGVSGPAVCLITAGPGEVELATELHATVDPQSGAVVYNSLDGLAAFAKTVASADALIASSTGPLHIAGAADLLTVGFFPSRRSVSPTRWAPPNSPDRHLPFSPPPDQPDDAALRGLDCIEAAARIREWLDGHGAG